MPTGVYEEITSHHHSDTATEWIKNIDNSYIYDTEVPQIISNWNLGKGETQVISFSYQHDRIPIIIDDKAAKKCANLFNIKVVGTIAVLIRAKQMNLVNEIQPLLYDLKANGFRISNHIIATALEIAGED